MMAALHRNISTPLTAVLTTSQDLYNHVWGFFLNLQCEFAICNVQLVKHGNSNDPQPQAMLVDGIWPCYVVPNLHGYVLAKARLNLFGGACLQVVALDPRYASRKTREFVTGDIRGRLKLSSQVSALSC